MGTGIGTFQIVRRIQIVGIDQIGNRLLVLTNQSADRYRLVLIDPRQPKPEKWENVIPEQADVLENIRLAGGRVAGTMRVDVAHRPPRPALPAPPHPGSRRCGVDSGFSPAGR